MSSKTITGSHSTGYSFSQYFTVTNLGTVTNLASGGAALIFSGMADTLVNRGTLTGNSSNGFGVTLSAGGSITNRSDGTITGHDGIVAQNVAATVVNGGSIGANQATGLGVYLGGGGSLTNQSGGTITGRYAIQTGNASVSVVNNGYIYGAAGVRGEFAAQTVVNAGTIKGAYFAVLFQSGFANRLIIDPGASFLGAVAGGGGALELASGVSAGTLSGLGSQFAAFSSATIDSKATWTLASGDILGNGVVLAHAATVVNAGAINDTSANGYGITLAAGGSVTNVSGATITGHDGIVAQYVAATVVNGGSIGANQATGLGVYLGGGGSLTNQSGGTITGRYAIQTGNASVSVVNNGYIYGAAGVRGEFAAQTVVNAGTIKGAYFAVLFQSGFANRLIIDPGASFLGAVAGGGGALELASGVSAGTLSGLGDQYGSLANVTLDPGATWTLAGVNTVSNGESVSIGAGADLEITGGLSGAPAFHLAGGSLHVTGSLNALTTFDLSDASGITADQLQLDAVSGPGLTDAITGFGPGDEIILPNVTFLAGATPSIGSGTLSVPLLGGGTFEFSDFTTAEGPASIAVGAHSLQSVVCFLAGTRIRTCRGDIAVEALRIGDIAVLADGGEEPVVWIGRRGLDCRRHPEPDVVWPIRITAGALAQDRPRRDLLVSPDHALYLNGVLVPARLLVNGASIVRQPRDTVIYYHVELRRHALLDAEGVAAESYLDTGNRGFFANAGEPLTLHPDLLSPQARREAESCAPFANSAELVAPIWRALAARAGERGLSLPRTPETTDDPALSLLADGRRLRPVSRAHGRYLFALPRAGRSPASRSVRLVSRTARPSDTVPWEDQRRLGVMLAALTLHKGAAALPIPLDHPMLQDGWWQPEWHGERGLRRWTNGSAEVPLPCDGPGLLEVKIAATVPYPLPADEPAPDRHEGNVDAREMSA